MMLIINMQHELQEIADGLVGLTVQRPSQSLSGHAAGLPFEELVQTSLEKRYPMRAYRHYEALNQALLAANESDVRELDCSSEALRFLVSRGEAAMKKWSPQKLFEEKQNDTAESIVFTAPTGFFEAGGVALIDVKTQRSDKKAQPPNIISAVKLANTAERVAKTKDEDIDFRFYYIGVHFDVEKDLLRCNSARVVDLMKIDPSELYINWAAATQIQFHPASVNQNFTGNGREWFAAYMPVFCLQLESRIRSQQKKLDRYRKVAAALC